MIVYHLSLFDYQSFQAEIDGIQEELAKGEFGGLQRLARKHMDRYVGMTIAEIERIAPFCLHGGSLPGTSCWTEEPDNQQIGLLFGAILNSFLTDTASFQYGDSEGPSLFPIYWKFDMGEFPAFGRPTASLVNKDVVSKRLSVVDVPDPYWHWIRVRGGREGWHSYYDIQKLRTELKQHEEAVRGLPFREYERDEDRAIFVHVTSAERETSAERLNREFDFVSTQYELANRKGTGIFASWLWL